MPLARQKEPNSALKRKAAYLLHPETLLTKHCPRVQSPFLPSAHSASNHSFWTFRDSLSPGEMTSSGFGKSKVGVGQPKVILASRADILNGCVFEKAAGDPDLPPQVPLAVCLISQQRGSSSIGSIFSLMRELGAKLSCCPPPFCKATLNPKKAACN